MPVSYKLNKTKRRELVRRANAGESYLEIARDLGVSDGTVSYHARCHGIRRVTRRSSPKPAHTPQVAQPKPAERMHVLVAVPKMQLSAVLGIEGVDLLDISAA